MAMLEEQRTVKEIGYSHVNMVLLNVMEILYNFAHRIELPNFMLQTMNCNRFRLLNASILI